MGFSLKYLATPPNQLHKISSNYTWPWCPRDGLEYIGCARLGEGGFIYAAMGESSFMLGADLSLWLLSGHPYSYL